MRIRRRGVVRINLLDQERDGIHPEPGQPELQPEADDLVDLVPHQRVVDVQVGLVRVEAMHVPTPGGAVVGPDALLLAGEDHALVRVRWLLVGPDVEVAVDRMPLPCLLEPGMVDRRVVDHEVGDHADPAFARDPHQLNQVAQRPVLLGDPVEVGDVVAVVAFGRGVDRHQPQAGDAEPGEVVDALRQAVEVADAVAVAVEERGGVDAVDDRVLPPQVAGCFEAHGVHAMHASFRRGSAGAARGTLGSDPCPRP